MDPAEAGDWLSGRPKQLVFLTGLDPANKKSHKALSETFTTRSPSSLPLNLRLVRGELDLPGKRALALDKGILRNDWPLKYLDKVPALIVLFLDLDWDHASWAEKKTEAESKCASIRASCRQGSRLAVVLLQERGSPTPADDPLATERAHDLCNACQLSPKHLFVVPMLCNDLHGYINKLEGAFHELAQGFYQQKLKAIRARSIPNNTPSLIVRQLFKLAFLSELRQDTHTALRNYRLAYEQCKESLEQWEDSNIFEWRSIVGLLNYKWCELCFLHSTAVESINQMRKHQQNFFNIKPGNYPTPQLASIEHQLWKARQCYNFAKLFEKAVAEGLTALPTLNPGAHLELAATIYSQAHNEIAQLKLVTPSSPYPSPDPLEASPVFLGQRPWRVGYEAQASPEVEQSAVTALLQRLIVNHAGVIDLLSAAMNQYKRYGCTRMRLKVVNEMAGVYYTSGDMAKALQLWCFAVEGLPRTVRQFVLQKAIWAAYTTAAVKDFVWCCLQLSQKEPETAKALASILAGSLPNAPYRYDLGAEQESKIEQLWSAALAKDQEFTLSMQKVDSCFQVEASFLKFDLVEQSERVPVLLKLFSSALNQATISRAVIHFGSSCEARPIAGPLRTAADSKTELTCEILNIVLEPQSSTSYVCHLDLSKAAVHDLETIDISKVVLELTSQQGTVRAQLVNDSSPKKRLPSCGSTSIKFGRQSGGIEADGELKVSCLVGEVTRMTMKLKNTTSRPAQDLRLEFNRNTQTSMAGSAVIFVDDSNDLRSELIIPIACPTTLEFGQTISVPIRFSAQLVGDMELCLEASHLVPGETQRRISKLRLSVTARDPFTISSQILTMNGIPVDALLNHNEHILKADIRSNADIVVTRIEWLLADVVTAVHHDEHNSKSVEEDLSADDVISFCKAVAISSKEEDVETPLGRLAVEWKRLGSETVVRSVSALCRLPVIGCPVTVSAKVDNAPSVVRQAIKIQYQLTNTTQEVVDLTATFEFMENFMYCGDKKVNFRLLPDRSRQIDIVVMALTGGRLTFPCPSLKSPTIADALLQQSLRSLPASLFVLPRAKDGASSDA